MAGNNCIVFCSWSTTFPTDWLSSPSTTLRPAILAKILDAAEFSLRRTNSVNLQHSQIYRIVDTTAAQKSLRLRVVGSLFSVSTRFRWRKRDQTVITRTLTGTRGSLGLLLVSQLYVLVLFFAAFLFDSFTNLSAADPTRDAAFGRWYATVHHFSWVRHRASRGSPSKYSTETRIVFGH